MLCSEHEAKASQPEVAEVGQDDMRKVAGGAAILFPVFARAREKARQTSCLSNMKQMDLLQ